jgi:hypothetical protein
VGYADDHEVEISRGWVGWLMMAFWMVVGDTAFGYYRMRILQ